MEPRLLNWTKTHIVNIDCKSVYLVTFTLTKNYLDTESYTKILK